MLPLAHLGLGSAAARAVLPRLPFAWLLVGTLLPDLIDKPVFIALGLIEHARSGGWVHVSRGFAHTLVFLALLGAIALARRSLPWAALAVGTATHLALDVVSKGVQPEAFAYDASVLLWPLRGWHFVARERNLRPSLMALGELLGLLALCLQFIALRRATASTAVTPREPPA